MAKEESKKSKNQADALISRGKFPVGSILDLALGLDPMSPLNPGGYHRKWIDKECLWKLKELSLGLCYPSRCRWCIHKRPFKRKGPFFDHHPIWKDLRNWRICMRLVWITLDKEGFRKVMDRHFFPLAIEATRIDRCSAGCAPKEWDQRLQQWHRSLMKDLSTALNRILRHSGEGPKVDWEMNLPGSPALLFWDSSIVSFTLERLTDWILRLFPQPLTSFIL